MQPDHVRATGTNKTLQSTYRKRDLMLTQIRVGPLCCCITFWSFLIGEEVDVKPREYLKSSRQNDESCRKKQSRPDNRVTSGRKPALGCSDTRKNCAKHNQSNIEQKEAPEPSPDLSDASEPPLTQQTRHQQHWNRRGEHGVASSRNRVLSFTNALRHKYQHARTVRQFSRAITTSGDKA